MNKFIFSFILLATFFISCGKDSGTNDPNNPNGNGGEQPTLTLSLTELTFKSAGEEKTFTITSNSNWTITNPSTWCKIDPIQGNSNTTITAIADPSEEYDDRNFNLTIKAGEITKVVTVTQKKKDAIILTKEKYDIPTEGDNITVEIKSNITYSTIIPEEHKEWIKQVETNQLGRGLETKNLNFEISANPSTDKREGIIVIKDNSSSLADTIHVYQAQKDELILTQDTYYVSSEGENINVELKSNVDYDVIIPEDVKDWVTQITSRSSRVDRLIFNIAQNQTYDNRSTKVIIKDKNSELADTLYINQTQLNALILTQSTYEIPAEGQNIKVEIKSNIKYEFIIPDKTIEWIKQIQSRALTTNIINLSISENTSYEQRTAEIVVKDKNSNLSDTIRITQKQNNAIILTQKKYNIPAEGQQISIEIKSNIEYDIWLSPDAEKWVEKIDLSRALTTNTLNYNILPNTTYNERKAEIIIKDKGGDLSDTVKIVQLPKSDTFIGDVIFITEQDLIDFKEKGYKKIKGNLTIEGEKLKTLQTLDNLITDIEGDLTIQCDNLTTFDGLKNLTKISGNFNLYRGNIANMDGLNCLNYIGGDFEISPGSLGALITFDGLNKLNTINGSFEIKAIPTKYDTPQLKLNSFSGLEGLKVIGENFYIEGGANKNNLSINSFGGLDNLSTIGGDFSIKNAQIPKSFDGISNLTVIGLSFRLQNLNLKDFTGLKSLNSIGENLIIDGINNDFESFGGLNKLKSIGKDLELIGGSSVQYENTFLSFISFNGLNNLETIGGNFKLRGSYHEGYSSFNQLNSFKGLEQLKNIGGNFTITSGSQKAFNSLSSFEGLNNLASIGGNFDLSFTSDAITSFGGLENLTSIGGDFIVGGSYNNNNTFHSHNFTSLSSFKGLSQLITIGHNFIIKGDTGYNSNSTLNSLTSFEGLEKLTSIGENFIIQASNYNKASKGSLNNLTSFNGLNNLHHIGGILKIIASGKDEYNPSLNSFTSFEGLENITMLGGLELDISAPLKKFTSFKGLNNLETINGNFIITADTWNSQSELASQPMLSFTSFKGLEKLTLINGDFEINALDYHCLNTLSSFEGLSSLNRINGNFKINSKYGGSLTTLTSLQGLESLSSIKNLSINQYSLLTLNGLDNLKTIDDKLIITGCHSLNNIAALKSLITIKDITIIQCPLLYNFCAIKNVVKDTDCNFYTEGNGYNPTKYQLLNGECSKLPEE